MERNLGRRDGRNGVVCHRSNGNGSKRLWWRPAILIQVRIIGDRVICISRILVKQWKIRVGESLSPLSTTQLTSFGRGTLTQ